MDHDGHCFRKVVHYFHWDAPERQGRIPFSRSQQDRPGFDVSYVVLIDTSRVRCDALAIVESGLQALDAGGPEGSATPLTRNVVYDRLHRLLRHLLSLIPTLPSTLQPLLVEIFLTSVNRKLHSLLRVTEYCSELADRIPVLSGEEGVGEQVGRRAHRVTTSHSNLQRSVILSSLSFPLFTHTPCGYQVCSPNVVMQFARVAQATDPVYRHSTIEANRRSSWIGCAFSARGQGRTRVRGTEYILPFRSVQASTPELVYTRRV